MTDLAAVRPYERRTDAVILEGGDADTAVRVAVRPSGTEPKIKSYIEVRQHCVDGDLDDRPSAGATHARRSWPNSPQVATCC